MTDDSSTSTTAAAPARSLVTRILAQWPQTASALVARGIGTTMPAGLPEDHYDENVLPVVVVTGHAVLTAFAEGRELGYAEIREAITPVTEQHVEERLPLGRLMGGIHASARVLVDAAGAEARPDEAAELTDFTRRLLDVLSTIDLVVVDAYTRESPFEVERAARRELCEALLRGRPAENAAGRAGTTVAARYFVVAVRLDDDSPAADSSLLVRRRERLFRTALDELTSDIVPATFHGAEGLALIADSGPAIGVHDLRWDDLARELRERFGVAVYLSVLGDAAPGGIPDAAGVVAELARLALELQREPGAYRIDDLLLEYQVTRPSPAHDRLVELVEPLFDQDHLLDALVAHLQNGGSRKAAADGLHLHPNSYLYRLRRVHELTGLDPNKPRESRILAAGLLVAGRWGDPLPQ